MITHTQLLKKLNEIKGFPPINPHGMCFGITLAISQEIFRGSYASSIRKLKLLAQTPEGSLQNDIAESRQQQETQHQSARLALQKKWRKGKNFNPNISFEKQLTSVERRSYYAELSHSFLEKDANLSEKVQDLLLMEAFFQTMIIYHEPLISKHLFSYHDFSFNQNMLRIFPKILPQSLMETKNGIEKPVIKKVKGWSGLYLKNIGQDDLKEYFRLFTKWLLRFDIENPVVFILDSGSHTCSTIFDPNKNNWRLVEPNNLDLLEKPTRYPIELAKYLWPVFPNLGAVTFETTVLAKNTDKKNVLMCIKKCHAEKSWQYIHTITKTKAVLTDAKQTSWLHIAIKMGDLHRVKLLLKKKALVNGSSDDKFTPLYIAAQYGHVKIIKELLKYRAEVNALTDENSTPVYIAASHGFTQSVKILLKAKAFLHFKTKTQQLSPLITSVENNHLKTTELLLKANAYVDAYEAKGTTALFFATQNNHVSIVKLLLKYSADPEIMNRNGMTPFLIAAQSGKLEILDVFLQKGILNIDDQGPEGQTAIFFAAQYNHPKIIELLLAKKAKVDIVISTLATALQSATLNGNTSIVKILLDAKAGVNHASSNGTTSLLLATTQCHFDILKLLLDAKADIDKPHNNGCTPLLKAIWTNHVGTVKLLLEADADIHREYKLFNIMVPQNIFNFITKHTHPEIKNTLQSYLRFSELVSDDLNVSALNKLKKLRGYPDRFKTSFCNYNELCDCASDLIEFIHFPHHMVGKKFNEFVVNIKGILQSAFQAFGEAKTSNIEKDIIQTFKISVHELINTLPQQNILVSPAFFHYPSSLALLLQWQIKYQVLSLPQSSFVL